MKALLIAAVGFVLILAVFRLLTYLSSKHNKLTPDQIADEIESFLDGSGGSWDWDEFLCSPMNDPELDRIVSHCARLPAEFPPEGSKGFCNAEGIQVLRDYVTRLRTVGTELQPKAPK